jgi:DNA-binding XRE family transcriptional regulator
MSQADLAKSLDITPANVNRWAKGEGVPSYELCVKLLEQGMTTEELFGLTLPQPVRRNKKPNNNPQQNQKFCYLGFVVV